MSALKLRANLENGKTELNLQQNPLFEVNEVNQREVGEAKLLKRWSGRRGSNPRRPAWEAGILPAELLPLDQSI